VNELSRTVVSDFVVAFPAAPARRGASAAPVATRLTVRKSRRVVMEALRVCGRCDALGGGDGRQGSRASSVGQRRYTVAETYLTGPQFQQIVARIERPQRYTRRPGEG